MSDLVKQPSLFDRREKTLRERFARFDAENPHVFFALVSIARRWKARGHRRGSADFLMHILRWETGMQTTGEAFKCNNDYASRYARKMMELYPDEFRDFFEVRELKAA